MFKTTNIRDAELDDIYIDGDGKLWRVIAICGEPTVHVQEIESKSPQSPVTKLGGISGAMWLGFERIHRPKKKAPPRDYRPKWLDGVDNTGY